MKKIFLTFLTLILLVSCSTQKQFNAFKKPASVSEIVFRIYVPIYMSYLPEPIIVIEDATDISSVISIINTSVSVSKIMDTGTTMGGSDTFDYQIGFTGTSLTTTMIYIKIDGEKIYLSTLELFDQDQHGYKLYEIQTKDRSDFLAYLKINE